VIVTCSGVMEVTSWAFVHASILGLKWAAMDLTLTRFDTRREALSLCSLSGVECFRAVCVCVCVCVCMCCVCVHACVHVCDNNVRTLTTSPHFLFDIKQKQEDTGICY